MITCLSPCDENWLGLISLAAVMLIVFVVGMIAAEKERKRDSKNVERNDRGDP